MTSDNSHGLVNYKLLRYVVITDKNEYVIHAADDIEAGYRAINLSGLLDEELKDVKPCEDDDTREQWIPGYG
tara:strand:+ start:61 stop:276 length:216 start_codon:yes stop_codon:yes gene_type:complete